MTPPKAFVSYSWDSDDHKAWVKALATRLRQDGVEVTLDHWHVAPGDQLPQFMETAVRENDFVLIVLTPNYKRKSDGRRGGVGYEGDIMTGEVFAGKDPRKFIPILRSGTWSDASPTWLIGKYGIDLIGDPYSDRQYGDLRSTLLGMREQAPPVGKRPERSVQRNEGGTSPPPQPSPDSQAIKIVGIIGNEVGTPRNGGTPGSALYSVPFQLSRRPSTEWAECFVQRWDRPPIWGTMHRPDIGRVEGDRIILDGTTVEEVAKYHRDTLLAVVDQVNRDIEWLEKKRRQEAEDEAERQRRHRQAVEDAAKRITFD